MEAINLDIYQCISIIGDRDSGKTNCAFYLMNSYTGDRQKVLYGYPKTIEGYKTISNWNDLLKLRDSIIFVDELQKYIRVYDKRANTQLMELVSLFAHNNNTLIFTTQLSQFITRGVEATIDCWIIKQIDLDTLKNGSKPKIILRKTAHPRVTEMGISLRINEFVMYSDKNSSGLNGVHTFPNQLVGKDWSEKSDKSAENTAKQRPIECDIIADETIEYTQNGHQ